MFDCSDISAVYYRRPKTPSPIDGTSELAAPFIVREARALLRNLLQCVEGVWISPMDAIERAENKLLQLKTAMAVGLRIPKTIVTTDVGFAGDFLNNEPDAITKPLTNGWLTDDPPTLAYTTRVDEAMRGNIAETVPLCPHLLQSQIDKNFDVRVTVVGSKHFACRIYSQDHSETEIDFRRSSATGRRLRHEIISLPEAIAKACTTLVEMLGLRFGAIDLVEDDDGFVFLEINPNGQWAWIEQLTGAPIAHEIAELLVQKSGA
jgi:glutathione synthase/RimK-type ligase-like ATP-grasp enzyme